MEVEPEIFERFEANTRALFELHTGGDREQVARVVEQIVCLTGLDDLQLLAPDNRPELFRDAHELATAVLAQCGRAKDSGDSSAWQEFLIDYDELLETIGDMYAAVDERWGSRFYQTMEQWKIT